MYDNEPDTRIVRLKNASGWVAGDFAMYPSKEHLPGSVDITWERSTHTGEWHCVTVESYSLLTPDSASSMTQTWHPLGAVHDLPEWLDTLIKQYAPKD